MKILQFKRGTTDSDSKRTSLTPGELYINTNNDSVWVGKENGQFQIGSYQSVVTDISANQSATDPTKVVLNITKKFANGSTSITPVTADISGTVDIANRLTTGSTSNQKIFYLSSGYPRVNTGVIGTGSESRPIYYNDGFKEITSLDIGQIKVTTITGQLQNKNVKFDNCVLSDIDYVQSKNRLSKTLFVGPNGETVSASVVNKGRVYAVTAWSPVDMEQSNVFILSVANSTTTIINSSSITYNQHSIKYNSSNRKIYYCIQDEPDQGYITSIQCIG